ncbi:hypothetical protein GWK47_035964 [Chionoecetes opilio]|uniref:Uncharacterized protein n=1 Tax=Chionoecetes opilio TaxID=41210 RepID=A0A8J4YTI8_CHIOP|nr:hypothetical protein GWK47_035964 [Chionoecetes opilio]
MTSLLGEIMPWKRIKSPCSLTGELSEHRSEPSTSEEALESGTHPRRIRRTPLALVLLLGRDLGKDYRFRGPQVPYTKPGGMAKGIYALSLSSLRGPSKADRSRAAGHGDISLCVASCNAPKVNEAMSLSELPSPGPLFMLSPLSRDPQTQGWRTTGRSKPPSHLWYVSEGHWALSLSWTREISNEEKEAMVRNC